MKAVMIIFNHGITEEVNEALEGLKIRGYTRFLDVHGVGTVDGEPHLGSHVWPTKNSVIFTIIQDDLVDPLLDKIKEIDREAKEQGIHAFVLPVEKMV